ncbi:hypothetical protein ACFVFS_24125 [Kitasatospora sp. NPDC057692]|uniref:hypothetical protein n=1 Tax=Kitasatospora sp. NPDC057692 TaxID=3346215 RepID=UPI0036896C80
MPGEEVAGLAGAVVVLDGVPVAGDGVPAAGREQLRVLADVVGVDRGDGQGAAVGEVRGREAQGDLAQRPVAVLLLGGQGPAGGDVAPPCLGVVPGRSATASSAIGRSGRSRSS